MPLSLNHRFLAIIATILLGVIAVTLLRGDIDIDAAAIRAAVLVAVMVVIDRFVMPFVMLALGTQGVAAGRPTRPPGERPID
jgi:hypothetical protein